MVEQTVIIVMRFLCLILFNASHLATKLLVTPFCLRLITFTSIFQFIFTQISFVHKAKAPLANHVVKMKTHLLVFSVLHKKPFETVVRSTTY